MSSRGNDQGLTEDLVGRGKHLGAKFIYSIGGNKDQSILVELPIVAGGSRQDNLVRGRRVSTLSLYWLLISSVVPRERSLVGACNARKGVGRLRPVDQIGINLRWLMGRANPTRKCDSYRRARSSNVPSGRMLG